jgi:hypothetical protein
MNWRNVAIGLGRLMGILNRAHRPGGQAVSRGIRVGGLAASVVLLLGLPVGAGDYYPAPGFFAGGLTPQSSWEEILKAPGIEAEFPMLTFGRTAAPLSALCVDGETVRIADPRLDNGVRLSGDRVRAQVQAPAAGAVRAARRDDPPAVGPVAVRPDQSEPAPIGYEVNVYKLIQGLSTTRVLLFQKPWEIPICSSQ